MNREKLSSLLLVKHRKIWTWIWKYYQEDIESELKAVLSFTEARAVWFKRLLQKNGLYRNILVGTYPMEIINLKDFKIFYFYLVKICHNDMSKAMKILIISDVFKTYFLDGYFLVNDFWSKVFWTNVTKTVVLLISFSNSASFFSFSTCSLSFMVFFFFS